MTSGVSDYVNDKVEVLNDQIENDNRELAQINRRISAATAQQTEILASNDLPLAERLLLLTNINSTIGFAEQRRGTVQTDLLQARQLLSLAERVEKSRVVEPAVAAKSTARSGRNAALVGGLIGLLLGAWRRSDGGRVLGSTQRGLSMLSTGSASRSSFRPSRRSSSSPRRCAGSRSSSTGSTSSTTRRPTRPPSGRAPSATRASR